MTEENNNDCLWVSKYRPQTVDDMCLDPSLTKLFNSYVDGSKPMQHLSLVGPRGIGKTTLAHILANNLSSDVLFVKCGNNGSVDDIRTKVTDFCQAQSMDGRNKTVIFDEADGLSSNSGTGSSAQDALRGVIEDSEADTRFILTLNYVNKIDAPILSRCTPVVLKFNTTDILKKLLYILDNEEVEYTKETMLIFHDKVIAKNFPDIRACINIMYMWVQDGKLEVTEITSDSEVSDFVDKLMVLLDKDKKTEARQMWLDNEALFCSYEELAGNIFNKVEDLRKRMIIGRHLAEMPHVLDKEINFTCMIYELYS